jgi:voltage-gated potassium channel
LIVSFAFSGFLIFVGAVSMFYIEGSVQPETFGSIPRALWWSVATLTTVGYGDVYPITPIGKILASLIALIGIAAVAMPAGILAAAFTTVTVAKDEHT